MRFPLLSRLRPSSLPHSSRSPGRAIALFFGGLLLVPVVPASAAPDYDLGFTPPPVKASPLQAPAGTWTLVILPDTQFYTRSCPVILDQQMRWILANQKTHQILMVTQVGDLVDNPKAQSHWEAGRKSFNILGEARIPFALALGNHDMGTGRAGSPDSRETVMNDYFSPKDYALSEAAGFMVPGRLEDSWQTFSAPTGKYLLISLEFGPRNEVLQWAGKIIEAHPDRTVILMTHEYLKPDGTRSCRATDSPGHQAVNPNHYPVAKVSDVNDGEDMWQKLVRKYPSIQWVICGHRTGVGYLVSTGDKGNPVHQLLSDFQSWPDCGGGYLRLMEFYPDKKTVRIRTYSPLYDDWLTKPPFEFTVALDSTITPPNTSSAKPRPISTGPQTEPQK